MFLTDTAKLLFSNALPITLPASIVSSLLGAFNIILFFSVFLDWEWEWYSHLSGKNDAFSFLITIRVEHFSSIQLYF